MNKLVKYLTIDEDFVYYGSIEDFKSGLNRISDVTCKTSDDGRIRLKSHYSLGTILLGGSPDALRAISVDVILNEPQPGEIRVKLRTNVRGEHYFIAIICVFGFLGLLFSDEPKWSVLLMLVVWLLAQIWVRFVFRYLEYLIVDKVVSKFGLRRS